MVIFNNDMFEDIAKVTKELWPEMTWPNIFWVMVEKVYVIVIKE